MINNDTVELLRECNAGIKMGISAIDEVLPKVTSKQLETILYNSREKHEKLGNETNKLLKQYGDDTKEPNPMAKGMSWLKTNTKLYFNESDNTVSDLITDGCNMGIKTLYRYLNEYKAADEKAQKLTEDIIREEESLRQNLRCYL